jgi:hypothetical protein
MAKNKRKDPEMTPRLEALINWVIDLRRVGLEACHYAEEFVLR